MEAPDGQRAGLVWEIGSGPITEILPATPDRWGVYGIYFPNPGATPEALAANFRAVLPALQAKYAAIRRSAG